MENQRGSTTIMAIMTMLVLTVAAASYSYITNRNISITQNYANGLQAQYTAEAAVKLMFVAGRQSLNPLNGWQAGQISSLGEWAARAQPITIVLPMGRADVTVTPGSLATRFNIQVRASANNVSRAAYAQDMDIYNTSTQTVVDRWETVPTAQLISAGSSWVSTGNSPWQLPTNLNDPTNPAISPGSGSNWASIASQVLFRDSLGLPNFTATADLQLLFRVNYYIKLTRVPGSGSGTGYGVYYLARKTQRTDGTWDPGNPGDPTSYVVQFDPGLNPSYSAPSGGAWGAAFSDPVNISWPYGAFLVKKAWSDGNAGWQDEVWDESGSYQVHYAFQDNNELTQRYYNASGQLRPNLTAANLVSSSNSSSWALQNASTSPASSAPAVTRVPTIFGFDQNGANNAEKTGKYRSRPPDLRLAYSLGHIAEGNPWQGSTYYPIGAKITAGRWVDNPLENRLVYVVTTAGVSGTTKPSFPLTENATVADGGVTWKAVKAPTPEQVAKYVLAQGISIAKISMSDLKFRLDSVNGVTTRNDPYSVPFTMLQGSKNKITVELWVDNQGNRVHIIRVNDVLALAFNDRYASNKYNIVPQNWEVNRTIQLGTGLRVWNATAEFYTTENYGQTLELSYQTQSNFGIWGR